MLLPEEIKDFYLVFLKQVEYSSTMIEIVLASFISELEKWVEAGKPDLKDYKI